MATLVPEHSFILKDKDLEQTVVALTHIVELLITGKKLVARGGIAINVEQNGDIRIDSDLILEKAVAPAKPLGEESTQYALRNPMTLDRAGGYYFRHVCAMTREGLHLKSKIAAELGYRDMEIDRLKGELKALTAAMPEIAEALGDETLTNVSQVATGIRDLRERLTTEAAPAVLPEPLKFAIDRFDAYFRSANGVPPNARISVPTSEWQALRALLDGVSAPADKLRVDALLHFMQANCFNNELNADESRNILFNIDQLREWRSGKHDNYVEKLYGRLHSMGGCEQGQGASAGHSGDASASAGDGLAVAAPQAQAGEQAPALYVSKGQLCNHRDPEGPDSANAGRYLPARIPPAGKFTTPLFAAPQAQDVGRGEVLVTVSGFTGSGKSAIAGEIEILCRALGLQVDWPGGDSEKNMTHADWTAALEQYKPRVRIVECNVPHSVVKGQDK